jgi:hypothetical protein
VDADQPIQSEPIEIVAEQVLPEGIVNPTEPMPEFASNYLPLTQFYGIQSMDQETQGKLQEVWQHFAKDAKTPSTVLKKIRMEHLNMQQPNLGDTSLNQMWNYIRILQDIAKAMKEAFRK